MVVGMKTFPRETGTARSWFGPGRSWHGDGAFKSRQTVYFSASCRKVSRLRVSMISADFSHTPPEFCFQQSPAPACPFAMPLPQLRLPPGGRAARTGIFPSTALLPLEGLCLSLCRTCLVPNRNPSIPQRCCLQAAINNPGSTVQLQQLCTAGSDGWSQSKKMPPPNFRSAFSK